MFSIFYVIVKYRKFRPVEKTTTYDACGVKYIIGTQFLLSAVAGTPPTAAPARPRISLHSIRATGAAVAP
jgi:hypothetical protein